MKGLSRLSSTSAYFLEARDGFSRLIRRVINILGKTVIVHRLPARCEEKCLLIAVDRGRLWYPRESYERIIWTHNILCPCHGVIVDQKSVTQKSDETMFLTTIFLQHNNENDRSHFLYFFRCLTNWLDTFLKIDWKHKMSTRLSQLKSNTFK